MSQECGIFCRTLELGEAIQAVLAEDAGLKELVHAEAAIERLQQSRCAPTCTECPKGNEPTPVQCCCGSLVMRASATSCALCRNFSHAHCDKLWAATSCR